MAVGFALLFSLTNAVLGVNRIHWRRASAADAFTLLPGVALATTLAIIFIFLFPESSLRLLYGLEIPTWLFPRPLLDPGLILVAAFVALGGFVFVRYRSRLITGLATRWVNIRGNAPPSQERALIVGGGETGQYASLLLTTGTHRDMMKIVGYVDDDFYMHNSRIRGINVIGRCRDIPELVSKYDIGVIIFAIHNITSKARREILDLCFKTPARTVFFPDIPATLSDIVNGDIGMRRNKSQTSNQTSFPSSPNSDLPCHICLIKLSPPQVNAWLDQLEHAANQGDMTLVLNQLQIIRRMVYDETGKLGLTVKKPE
jgi:FlaA1/EpsC-like NDP-sugar epimerase